MAKPIVYVHCVICMEKKTVNSTPRCPKCKGLPIKIALACENPMVSNPNNLTTLI